MSATDQKQTLGGHTQLFGEQLVTLKDLHEFKNDLLIGDGDDVVNRIRLLYGWTNKVTVFTNGQMHLNEIQQKMVAKKKIPIYSAVIEAIIHIDGLVKEVRLTDGSVHVLTAIFSRVSFERLSLAEDLRCSMTDAGYIKADEDGKTNIEGAYAAGDCTTAFRTVATSCAAGLRAAISINQELANKQFN